MGILNHLVPLLSILALVCPALAQAPNQPDNLLDAKQVYEVSQSVIGSKVGAHVLRDKSGGKLDLAELRGRPLVISLVYTSCSSICPVTTDHLHDAVADARLILGEDSFAVLTFGFDASSDKPAQLRAFASIHRLNRQKNWFLASADTATTEALLHDLGFSWREAAGGFDHPSQTTILDGEGRVYRQLYGEDFPLPVFMAPLKELVLGRTTLSISPQDLWNRLTFLCTNYNPLTRSYRFDYGLLFGIFFGAVSLLLCGLVIVKLWLEKHRHNRRNRCLGARETVDELTQ